MGKIHAEKMMTEGVKFVITDINKKLDGKSSAELEKMLFFVT